MLTMRQRLFPKIELSTKPIHLYCLLIVTLNRPLVKYKVYLPLIFTSCQLRIGPTKANNITPITFVEEYFYALLISDVESIVSSCEFLNPQ